MFPCVVCALCGAGYGDSDGRLSAAEVGDVARRPPPPHLYRTGHFLIVTSHSQTLCAYIDN